MPYKDLDHNLRTRFRTVIPADRWDAFIRGIESRKPQTFRSNRLKTVAEALEKSLADAKIAVSRIEGLPDAYRLDDPRDIVALRELPIYTEGMIYSQGLASQIPAHCMDLAEGLRVLDATAAPGAKTTQIASLMAGTGMIDACESAAIRYEKLAHTVAAQGASAVETHRMDVREFLKMLPEDDRYDRILLDAPCSAMGRIWTENEKTHGYWKADLPSRHAKLQSTLLDACLDRLAPEGVLVYSTCTLSTEENEGVLSHVLKRHPDCRIAPIGWLDALPEAMPALERLGDFVFREGITNARRIVPSERTEGFFVAKIVKK